MTVAATRIAAPAAPPAVLTAREEIAPGARCDQCRVALAKTRLTFITGSVLLLCAHHYRQHELALETDPTVIVYTEPNTCPCLQCTAPRKD